MKFLLPTVLLFLLTDRPFNQNKGYVSHKKGLTMIIEGGWKDTVAEQKLYDSYLDFIDQHVEIKDSTYRHVTCL